MSEITSLPKDADTLAQRLQNAEKSIIFLQREHASTLANLHTEITKWQQKCSGNRKIRLFLFFLYTHEIHLQIWHFN